LKNRRKAKCLSGTEKKKGKSMPRCVNLDTGSNGRTQRGGKKETALFLVRRQVWVGQDVGRFGIVAPAKEPIIPGGNKNHL